jgi:DNA modification methylase
MKTTHVIHFADSRNMDIVPSESIDLMVTSPPYPMIEMWDDIFCRLNPDIRKALKSDRPIEAYEMMHKTLDPVWDQVYRVLKDGGLACINIGDATRTINNNFALYPNHSRIMSYLQSIGFSALPAIIWRKQTNAPNKFMGSGMLPPGAYVTLEHEYVLIVRKGGKMIFDAEGEKENRRASAFFWEERNNWFSDVWMDLKGTPQKMKNDKARLRSGAFPFELPYRLINMFSVKGGAVLDPFLGTGTTMAAAMAAGRNSLGFELDSNLHETMTAQLDTVTEYAHGYTESRLAGHVEFVKNKQAMNYGFKYMNKHYGFPVMTRQETELLINLIEAMNPA